jgi:(1->4)-alpha-D-glucan 1-alpha-D-glucosylmutase
MHSGAVKLFIISRILKVRREKREVFEAGKYSRLTSAGTHKNSIIAFSRRFGDEVIITAVPRFLAGITQPGKLPLGKEVWRNTCIKIPYERKNVKNLLTGEHLPGNSEPEIGCLMDKFPAAVLSCEVKG